jgi:hypothetical protein
MREKFIHLKQGSMSVVEYLDKFTTLARYALDETDTEDKKRDHFLNGLHDEMQCVLETSADAAIMMEDKRKTAYDNRKRKMMMQNGGASNHRSCSMPPPRSIPQQQRTPRTGTCPNNPHRQFTTKRSGIGTLSNNNNRNNTPTHAPASGCFTCGQPEHFLVNALLRRTLPSVPVRQS